MKTAGTSIESYFEPFCMPDDSWHFSGPRNEEVTDAGIIGYRGARAEGKTWYNHMPATRVKDLLGDEKWNQYFKFCAIRNPFDKLISWFHFFEYQLENRRVSTTRKREFTQLAELVGAGSTVQRFRRWVRFSGFPIDRSAYIINGNVCMDYFIRYEELVNGIEHVCNTLKLPFRPNHIPKLKSGIRPSNLPTEEYYDKKTIAITEERFALEIQLFQYSFPSKEASTT